MVGLQVIPFSDAYSNEWEQLVAASRMGTTFHRRAFINYHRDRFIDRSLCIVKKGRIVGVMPAAELPGDRNTICSHPGLSFAGIVHTGELVGPQMLKVVQLIVAHYAVQGFTTLQYRATPNTYRELSGDDDLYALEACGARRTRVDLSCVIDLAAPYHVDDRQREAERVARRLGFTFHRHPSLLPQVWKLAEANLRESHGLSMVHTVDELQHIETLCPGTVSVTGLIAGTEVIGGLILFALASVMRPQNIGANEVGRRYHAHQLLLSDAIASGRAAGMRYFDLGTSNTRSGGPLRASLFDFKRRLGPAAGIRQEHFELSCERAAEA